MPSKRAIATVLSLHADYLGLRDEALKQKPLIKDNTASFEARMAASDAIGRVNEGRLVLFPQIRDLVFGMPKAVFADLTARYLELDEQRSNVQAFIRTLTAGDHDKVMEATSHMGDNVETECKIVEDAIERLKNYKNEKKNGT